MITWMIFGIVVGITAYLLDAKQDTGGLIGAIVLGILGAIIGGYFGTLLFGMGNAGFSLSAFMIAISGSLIVLYVGRTLRQT